MPYLHVRVTPGELDGADDPGASEPEDYEDEGAFASLAGEAEPFKI